VTANVVTGLRFADHLRDAEFQVEVIANQGAGAVFSSRTVGKGDMVLIAPAPTYEVGDAIEHDGLSYTVAADLDDHVELTVQATRFPLRGGGALQRAQIVPQQARWPAPEYVHWQRLHAVPDEARERVSRFHKLVYEIDRNTDLSPEGKERQRRKVALQAVSEFEASKTLARAREAVAHVMDQWNAKVG
jgi:hypothetical protein